ncbi:MAG: YbjQ family protein [Ruminococcaceae bacterium]|nr:YbjQ family protein [Oscillospiraceae bacterium]
MDRKFITTTFDFKGYKISEYYGMVRGITVRSRSVVGNIGAGLQSVVGGNITIYTKLCEQAREEAFQNMIQHAENDAPKANALIGVRYDANEVAQGITEVICYGTAVTIEKE